MKSIIQNKYKRDRDSDLTTTGKRVVEKMKINHSNFPNTPAALATLEKLLPEYHDSVANAKGRDKEMVAIKKAKKAAVVALLTELANYVTLTCNGDEALLLSSGFDIIGGTEQQLMPAIEKLEVELGPPGVLITRIKRVPRARAYMHQFTTESPTSESVWISEGSTQAFHTFSGLKSGVKYWLRVVALGPAGQTVYSPVETRIIQ